MSIKGMLREELENSLEMQKNYERELAKLPKGSLVRRMIRGAGVLLSDFSRCRAVPIPISRKGFGRGD